MSTMPAMLRAIMKRNLNKLMTNSVALQTPGATSVTVTNGVPVEEQTFAEHWAGEGSIQYVRPRIQKSFPDVTGGTMEDSVAAVAYLPFDAQPTGKMLVVDTDGVLGPAGSKYVQSREPANVGGANVYWECYIGRRVTQ